MDDPPSQILFTLVFLIFLSSFFSGSEAALLSITRAKVRALLSRKRFGSHALEWLKNHPKKLIITILIGNNIVNILIPVLATIWATKTFGDHILGVITGILTVILLVFGEILPKNIGQLHNEKFSLFVAPIIFGCAKILSPVVWIFEKFSDSLISKKGHDPITEDEVLAMVSLGAEGGAIEKEEKKLIENVLEFSDTMVEEVMTPRANIDLMDENTPLGEAVEFFISHSHSRIPVYAENVDQIVGIITIKQTLKAWREYEDNKLIKNLELKTPMFVPPTKKIADLFQNFQRQRIHMAIVIDEHGGTVGVITLEDILEEVFGEIVDESDVEDIVIKKLSDRSWSVPANIDLEDLREKTNIVLEAGNEEGKNLARFILEQTEDIPDRGDIIETPAADLAIERMSGHKIERVRIMKK